MFNVRKIMAALSAAATIFAFAACGSSDPDNPISPPEPVVQKKAIYTASTNLSDYAKKSYNASDYQENYGFGVPELFVVSGADLKNLSATQIGLAIQTCLEGKTLLIDAPTPAQIATFGVMVETLLASEGGAELKAKVALSPDFPRHLFAKMAADAAETPSVIPYKQRGYEAIGIRQNQIYFVHDIDEAIEVQKNDPVEQTANIPNGGTCSEAVGKLNTPSQARPTDWAAVTDRSAQKFASWVSGSGAALVASSRPASVSASAVSNEERKPQTFIHNFNVTFNHDTDHYDGRYNGRTETVEVVTDVWAACDIDHHEDTYLVRTSLVCNNQQLGFKNEWDDSKYVGPYFNLCEFSTALDGATVRDEKCEPKNASGSTTFTTGTSFSLSGNVGFNMSGPTGGVGAGYSVSESTSRSIPDINVVCNGKSSSGNSISWSYTTPGLDPYWDWFVTKCDNPKQIQYVVSIFDTYTIYTLASDPASSLYETVTLKTQPHVKIEAITGWLTDLGTVLHWKKMRSGNTVYYNDCVTRPCNTWAEYIMSFTPPSSVAPEQADRLHSIVKEYISDWNSIQRYYAYGNTRLDSSAKAYFASVKQKISDNKNIFKTRGFSGTFKFFIQKVSGGTQVDSFELTF